MFWKFTGGVARYPPYFGRGRGTIFLDELECNGTETKLVECDRHGRWGKHNCYHREDAGVHCFNENNKQTGRPTCIIREVSFFTGRGGPSVCDCRSPIFSGPPLGLRWKILVPPLPTAKKFVNQQNFKCDLISLISRSSQIRKIMRK